MWYLTIILCCSGVGAGAGGAEGSRLCSHGHCGEVEVPSGRQSSPTVAVPHFHINSVGWSIRCFILIKLMYSEGES